MFDAANQRQIQRAGQIAALFAAAFAPLAGQSHDPASEALSVYVNVEKDDGFVEGLTEANFRLEEDGHARKFKLEPPERPASIGILVEYSRASGYYYDDLAATMRGFQRYALDGHWYALATFSHGMEVSLDFTRQPMRVVEAFASLGQPSWNEIDTYDAVYTMLDRMSRLPGRKILIVVGSGLDTFSEHNLGDVKEKLESSNVTVFVAGAGSLLRTSYDVFLDTGSRLNLMQARAFLQMLADRSGGFAWFPQHFNGFPEAVQAMMQRISLQYRLVYESTSRGSGKFHKIIVEAFRVVDDKREDFKVRVREGWR